MKLSFKFIQRYIKCRFSECAECNRYETCDRKPWLHDEENCNYNQHREDWKRGGRQ